MLAETGKRAKSAEHRQKMWEFSYKTCQNSSRSVHDMGSG